MEKSPGGQVIIQPAENNDVIKESWSGDSEDDGIVVTRPVDSTDLGDDNDNGVSLSHGTEEQKEAMNVQSTAQTYYMPRAVEQESTRTIWSRVKIPIMYRTIWSRVKMPIMYRILAASVLMITLAYFAATTAWPKRELAVAMIGGNVARGISADDPRWPKLEQHLEQCNEQLRQTEDAETISFFQEASAAPAGDMQDAMNRYLYFAIMHAVVLGRSYSDTVVYAPGEKVGMSDVRTYLNVMLKTMEKEEITSKGAPADQLKEMNRYLYLTIVQAGVLHSKYSAPDGKPPHPLAADAPTPSVEEPAPAPRHATPPAPLPSAPNRQGKLEAVVLVDELNEELRNQKKHVHEFTTELQNEKSRVHKLTTELQSEKKQVNYLTMELHTQKTQVDKLAIELQNEKTQVDKLAIELQNEKTQVDLLRMELLNEKKRIDVLKTSLITCTHKYDDCSKKLEDCQGDKVPSKTASEPHGSGDYDDEEWVSE